MKIQIKDKIAEMVVRYYAQFPELKRDDVLHTQEVVSYTRIIAVGEEMTDKKVALLEMAAWLHDIGCPRSKELYGNSLPVNQQNVGREVTMELLEPMNELNHDEKQWIADVVGTHHQYPKAVELDFLPLFEADLIVNCLSGYHPKEKHQHLYDTMMKTATGRTLFEQMVF